MPFTFRAASANYSTVNQTYNMTLPTGHAQGDLLVACFTIRGASLPVLPSPWKPVFPATGGNTSTTASAATAGQAMFYCLRGATAPSVAVTRDRTTTTTDLHQVNIMAFSGGTAAEADLIDVYALTAAAGAIATTRDLTGVTTTEDEDLIVAMFNMPRNGTLTTTLTAATDPTTAQFGTAKINASSGTAPASALGVWAATKTAKGATGTIRATHNTSQFIIGAVVAFRSKPPAGAPPAPTRGRRNSAVIMGDYG